MSKGTKELEYKHWFVCQDGKFYWDRPDLLRAKMHMLNNRRGFAIITYAKENITPGQYAFYFGGIIRGECMHSNCFQNVNEKEIHKLLFKELRTYTKEIILTKKDGSIEHSFESFTEDFDSYSKEQMSKYIEELIPYLAEEYGIHIKDKNDYQYNQYVTTRKEI